MPAFAPLEGERLRVADKLINVFSKGLGCRQGEILGAIKELEASARDYRFVRGLKTLLLRQCIFEVKAVVAPFLARKTVFKEASATPVLRSEDRVEVLRKAAAKLEIGINDLEEALWADNDEELILKEFREIQAGELLKRYNTSLAQTMLFKAVGMNVRMGQGHRDLLWRVNRLGLMYSAERQGSGICIHIAGPASLMKMTEKYGTAMAKLLPTITASPSWEIRADIVLRNYWTARRRTNSPRILEFRIDDSMRELFTGKGHVSRREKFDSMIEEKFFKAFNALRTEWTIVREPEPLVAGGKVFMPDFLIEKKGIKVYLEIVGFWTREYLDRKLSKLRTLERVILVLAVDKSLACSGFKELKNFAVIYYEKDVPLRDIFSILRKIEEKEVKRDLKRLIEKGISLKGDIVDINALAREEGASYEAVKRAVSGADGYALVGKELVSLTKLNHIKQKLKTLPEHPMYEDVAAMVRKEGIKSVPGVLKHLGYEVKWESLDAKTLRVYRRP
jgi:hypothetical protein